MDKQEKVLVAASIGLIISGAVLEVLREKERRSRVRRSRSYYRKQLPSYYATLSNSALNQFFDIKQYNTDRKFNEIIKDL